MVAPNEDSHLFFQGGVAAQKLYASCLQGLHACVLIDGIGVVGIFGSRFRLQPALTSIEGVLHRGLSDCRVGYVQPLADFVLVPDIVVVVQQVGGAVKRSHDLDLILRNSETESQAIQGILDATQGRPIVDANDVEYLFDSGRVVGELLKFSELPFGGFPDELRFGHARNGTKQAERRDTGHRTAYKRSACCGLAGTFRGAVHGNVRCRELPAGLESHREKHWGQNPPFTAVRRIDPNKE